MSFLNTGSDYDENTKNSCDKNLSMARGTMYFTLTHMHKT